MRLPTTLLDRLTRCEEAAATSLSERARGAERVIVGRVSSVNSEWRVNDFGDRLIVSVVRVAVDETLKGQAQQTLDVEVEGGTIGDLTLRVSDLAVYLDGAWTLAPGSYTVRVARHAEDAGLTATFTVN